MSPAACSAIRWETMLSNIASSVAVADVMLEATGDDVQTGRLVAALATATATG